MWLSLLLPKLYLGVHDVRHVDAEDETIGLEESTADVLEEQPRELIDHVRYTLL